MAENLALACVFCNRFKGTDLGSLNPAWDHIILGFQGAAPLAGGGGRCMPVGRLVAPARCAA